MTEESHKEQVRSVIYTMEHPHSINWIADTAGIQWETAERHLEELEKEGLVVEVDGEYKPDTTGLYIREIRKLIQTHDAEELVKEAKELEQEIEDAKSSFEVESISALEERARRTDSVSEQRRLYDVIDGLQQKKEVLKKYQYAIGLQRDAERSRHQQAMEELGSTGTGKDELHEALAEECGGEPEDYMASLSEAKTPEEVEDKDVSHRAEDIEDLDIDPEEIEDL